MRTPRQEQSRTTRPAADTLERRSAAPALRSSASARHARPERSATVAGQGSANGRNHHATRLLLSPRHAPPPIFGTDDPILNPRTTLRQKSDGPTPACGSRADAPGPRSHPLGWSLEFPRRRTRPRRNNGRREGGDDQRDNVSIRRRACPPLPRDERRCRSHLEGGIDHLAPDDQGPPERKAADRAADLRPRWRSLRDRRFQGRGARASRLVSEPRAHARGRATGRGRGLSGTRAHGVRRGARIGSGAR